MESRSFSPTGLDALPRLDSNMDVKGDTRTSSAPLEESKDAMELDDDKTIQRVGSVAKEDVSGASGMKDNNDIAAEQLKEEKEKKEEGGKVEEDVASEIEGEVSLISAPAGASTVTNSITADTVTTAAAAAAGDIAVPAAPSALTTTPPARQLGSSDMSERLPVPQPQLSTPQQQVENMRRAAEACRPLIFNDIPPPSPIVEPGALHELGDPTSPNRRRSSATAGIAGLEELRRDRMDQLIHATGFDGAGGNSQGLEYEHTIDAFIKLNFDDGNVYYVKNSSVIFGRMEGATSNTFQQVGPDGSTVIGGGIGFEHPTTSGVMGMKREKKKRRKKKDDVSSKKSKSTTSGGSSAAPVTSRRGSAFSGQPQFPLFRDPFGFQYGNRGNRFTQEDETPMIYLPPPNPSGEQEVASAAPPKKNISRKHAKLAYNAVRGWFELDIMGKNGAFVNEEFVQVGTKLIIDPKEGTKVQIGGVSFVVYVPEHLEGGPEVIEHPAVSGGMGKGKGGKGKGGNGKSTKGKLAFSFSDDNDMESDLSDPDVAMSDDEGSVDGSDADRENESGEESDQDSNDGGEGGRGDGGEESDMENSGVGGSEEEEDSPSPEPIKVEKRGRGRPRKDQTEAQRKELAKAKAAAERAKAKEKGGRQREKLEAQRRERELEKERGKKRLEAQRQKEERRRQKERLQKEKEEKEKEKRRLHLSVSTKGGGEEAKKERKLYLPPPPSAKSEKPSAPTQERKGPGRPPKEKKAEVQIQTPLQPPLPQQPSPSTQQPQQENLANLQRDTKMFHPSYDVDLGDLAPLAAANLAMSMIDPALSYDSPQAQPAPVVDQPAPKEQKKGKPKKEKKLPPKRKRTPSPEINEADYPPEALLKPSVSYVVLIHEVISASERGALTLPEIYKAIERKYPYYKLKVTTNGWQSSVRHNLGQHKAFYKVERSGKGWLWGCVKGVSIEKEKKGSAATRPINPAGYAPETSNGHHNVQNGQAPSLQYYNGVPQPPYYLQDPLQQPQYQQAPPAPSAVPAPRLPPAYHAPIPSAASLKQQQPMPPSQQQQPPASAQSGGHSSDFDEAIIGLQTLIRQHKDTPGPRSPELVKMATEVVRSLVDKDPGAMEAIRKLTAFIKQIDQTRIATQSPVPQQYQQHHEQAQSGKGKGVASSAFGVTATTPTPAVLAQPVHQNNNVGDASIATSSRAPVLTPQAKHPVPINIKDLSPEEKAALVKRLLQAKRQKELAAMAAETASKVAACPPAAVHAPAPVTPASAQTSPLHASPPAVNPVSAPISSPVLATITAAAPMDSTQVPTTRTPTKRPRELEPEAQDLEAKRQNTG